MGNGSHEFSENRKDIHTALEVGLAAELDDPSVQDTIRAITPAQIDWIASWLAGEGFGKLDDPREALRDV